MTTNISISDFSFEFLGKGAYNATYTSPMPHKQWTTRTTNMPLIDETKNSESPKIKNLNYLKSVCKNS